MIPAMGLELLTAEQKRTFLDAIRAGDDRQQAAQKIGVTGSFIKRMMNVEARNYDADFTAAYSQALAERNPETYERRPRDPQGDPTGQPMRTTLRGFTKANYITDEERDTFLEMVGDGEPHDLAARHVGTSLRQISILCQRNPGFAELYRQATLHGKPALEDKIRAQQFVEAFENGNYQALRDLAIIHLPEADRLKTSRHEIGGPGGGPIKILQAALPNLPPEILEAAIQALEQQQQPAIEASR